MKKAKGGGGLHLSCLDDPARALWSVLVWPMMGHMSGTVPASIGGFRKALIRQVVGTIENLLILL